MTVALRTSERNLFKRCQWAWERNYVDRIEQARHSPALWFGTGIHLAMEHWYVKGTERGRDPRETFTQYVKDAQADTKYINTYQDGDFSEAVTMLELGVDMLTGYLAEYGKEPHIEVIEAESSFQVKVPYREWVPNGLVGANLLNSEAFYVGTFDQVFRDLNTGQLWLRDFKTAKALGSQNTQYLPLDDQAGAYWAVADYTLRKQGLIGQDEAITGVMYDYLVKAKQDRRPRNEDGLACNKPQKKHYVEALNEPGVDKMKLDDLKSLAEERGIPVFGEVSAKQPSKLLDRVEVRRSPAERRSQIGRIQSDLEAMSLVRNGIVPATKTPVKECSFCPFLEICELDEDGKPWDDFKDQLFTPWDPYASHEEGMRNQCSTT